MEERFSGGGRQRQLAEVVGCDPTYISRLINGYKQLGEGLAREFERKLGKPRYWFDRDESCLSPGEREAPQVKGWPFKRFSQEQIEGLHPDDQEEIESAVVGMLKMIRRHDPPPVRKKTS